MIKAPAEKIYSAIPTQEGLSPETQAKPGIDSIARFAFGPNYFKEMKIIKPKPLSKVEWLCLKYEEWIGTTLTFELKSVDKGTVLFFRHDGWKDYTAEFTGYMYDWAFFPGSLRLLCETGKGRPFSDQY